MNLAAAAFILIAFLFLIDRLGVVDRSVQVLARARRALADMRDPDLEEEAREKAVQAHSLALLRLFVVITVLAALALGLPITAVLGFDALGVVDFDAALEASVSWPFLIVASVLGIGAIIAMNARRRRSTADDADAASGMDFAGRYGGLDRMLHRVAFCTGLPQVALADLEDRLFRKELDGLQTGSPVFVTALPRAGTTILLEVLVKTGEFAAHTYRDMPFVLTPMIWQRMSRFFQKERPPQERAHGDGIVVGLESPEAFEEMIWKRFWPEHYRGDSIKPWVDCHHEDFVPFFTSHMRKIVALRNRRGLASSRYLSKNNVNVARIPALFGVLPEARLVVPFRDPVQHAASLLKQHRRFSELHERDGFARQYMRSIGHHDFGANLKPIAFEGFEDPGERGSPDELSFWVAYWVATYRHVLTHASDQRIAMVCFETLCEQRDLSRLAEALSIDDVANFTKQGSVLTKAAQHQISTEGIDPRMIAAANDLYEELRTLAVI